MNTELNTIFNKKKFLFPSTITGNLFTNRAIPIL